MQQVQFRAMLSGEQGCAGDSSIGGHGEVSGDDDAGQVSHAVPILK